MNKSILSSDQIHTLYHTFYEPTVAVKSTLLIVHGMTEHSGRYEKFAQYLADKGIAVLTYDHLGHGRSINTADELGYFSKQYPVQTLLKDTMTMANHLKERYPNVPHFIMGHSMGSFITRNVLQNHSFDFAGAILMGTSDFNPLIKGILPVAKMLDKVKPKQPNPVFSKATNKILNSKLKNKKSSSKFAWLLKDAQALKHYEDDPLTGFDFTNNGYMALFSLMDSGLEKDWAYTIDKDFPMLFVSGKEDPVGNTGKGIKKLTKRLNKQGFSQVQTKLYADMRHEPLHEKDHLTVYNDILSWIEIQAAR